MIAFKLINFFEENPFASHTFKEKQKAYKTIPCEKCVHQISTLPLHLQNAIKIYILKA